ncbi:MAG TPA: phosphate starvation-inducible protein PhoH [Verrucomicrobiales bacterium]|nr:MAG: PhoH family protein [Limisphaerales bacterium]HAR00302.1 phosphate starvation-inducible protein PhoH [Verrucomicrobiales bacterium]HCZ02574.1 phosphate starvation-inducible protein PhoH [Verrucomicrobiales bacterium]
MISDQATEGPSLFEKETNLRQDSKQPISNSFTKRKSPKHCKGLLAPSKIAKNFILDTNVLLHDPSCISRFDDNHVCIPVEVLTELDRFKNEPSDRGANAREVHRTLVRLFETSSNQITSGIPTAGGGSLRIVISDVADSKSQAIRRLKRVFTEWDRIDHRILACTLLVMEHNSAPVVLVTKDLNLQLKAKTLGISCEDYLNDKVSPKEISRYGIPHVTVKDSELQRFASSGMLFLPEDSTLSKMCCNQYALLRTETGKTMPARLDSNGALHHLKSPNTINIPRGMKLIARNLEQQCYLDALLDPSIKLVTCYGQAGTGKTLLAMAAGLHLTLNDHQAGMTVSRPVVTMGKDIGFLPGTMGEKMDPWLQPIHDALEILLRPDSSGKDKRKQKKDRSSQLTGRQWQASLIEQGLLEIEALCFIRGRSIPNRYFVLDEAQQLTPLEAKTVVTRMSQGSKLVLIGDPAQIDNPYVDNRSNGLVYTRNKLKGQPFAAHVSLNRGERSELAEAGANLM